MTGTLANPATLYDALTSIRVWPGDTILLRGGTYSGDWIATIAGTADNRITIRPYQDERVIIDGTFTLGQYVDLIDVEIVATGWTIRTSAQSGGNPTDIWLPANDAIVLKPGARIINCTIHDGREGFSALGASGAMLYGNLIYNHGWRGTDRGHGHGVYFSNNGDLCTLALNVLGQNFGWGIHLYSASYSNINNFALLRNVVRCNANVMGPDYAPGQLKNITYEENTSYRAHIKLAYSSPADADNLIWSDNYWHGVVELKVWQSVKGADNVFVASSPAQDFLLRFKTPDEFAPYDWDGNEYYLYDGVPLRYSDMVTGTDYYSLEDWQAATGLDAASGWYEMPGVMPPDRVYVWSNEFAGVSKRKALIAIYNWTEAESVNVDLSGAGLELGESYVLLQAQDPLADITPFVYDGDPLAIDMRAVSHSVAVPVGHDTAIDSTTFPTFGAFVIEKQTGD